MSKVVNQLTDAELEAWAAVLESGKYEQGQSSLCWGGQHCCLGVLVAERDELDGSKFIRTGEGFNLVTGISGPSYYIAAKDQKALAHANDSGKTFAEIAAMIRTDLIGKGATT